MTEVDAMTATEPSPADIMRGSVAAVNEHNVADVPYWDDRTVYHAVGLGIYRGADDVRGYFDMLFAAMPDFRLEVDRMVTDETNVAMSWNACGTFDKGRLYGVAATGQRLTLRGVDMAQLDGPIIVANTIYTDGLSFPRQIGMLPPDGSVTDRVLKGMFNTLTLLRRRATTR
ncbi:ester cyclase [Nocardia sp. NBC_00508]|uniref:ester cyclase n=1 Tax=Nocardia sp. NBC_00508 TaxID=2975992 RepID=UPI002E80F614|nr:ester cyclase [Nocardia sp. NBC_00508]WUD64699.1 ester cyclase [Nocardia sp. NBC_00508]